MKINNGDTKKLIMDVMLFSDDVNEKGERLRRQTFKKDHLWGIREIKDKISEHVEVAVVSEDGKETFKWIKAKEYKPEDGRAVAEKYNDGEIEFSEKALNALKFYFNDREDVIEVNKESLEEIESVLGIA